MNRIDSMFLLLVESPKLILLSFLISTMILLSHFGGKPGHASQGGIGKGEIQK